MSLRVRKAAKQLTSPDPKESPSREVLMLLTNVVDVTGQDETSVVVRAALNVPARRKTVKMAMNKAMVNKEEIRVARTSLVKDASVADSVADMAVTATAVVATLIVVVGRNAMELHLKMMVQLGSQKASVPETETSLVHHAEVASEEAAREVVIEEVSVAVPDVLVQDQADPEDHVVVMFRMVSLTKEATAHQEEAADADSPDLSVHATLKVTKPVLRR
jgi:hypothetical protein